MITVDELIAQLAKFKTTSADAGKIEVMLEFDGNKAFEFHAAEVAVCSHSEENRFTKFLVFRPYTNKAAKSIDIKPRIFM